jgi:NADH:ubiquinone oxidoreductase subunit F (NADH-binding)
VREPHSFTLDSYLRHQGYEALRKSLGMTPDAIIDAVKASGLRGRGGAGFPTGMKWQFVDKKVNKPRYICCNADESEPGTFKDHLLMERNPHLLIEGCAIACYAIGAKVAYIYIRGEFLHVQHILEAAIAEAYKAGYLGRNVLGSGFDCEVYVHRGAGAYEAGEETALIESLEGKRAQPRIKPPFPAAEGLYGCPTAVNNVETLCNVPAIITRGVEWYTSLGPGENGGPKLFCVSGHVNKPASSNDDAHDRARVDLRLRRRHPERAAAQGGDSWRIVGADPAAESDRCAGELRRPDEGRHAPRIGRHDRDGRQHVLWCGRRRTSCTSIVTSRAASARPAARAETGC